MTAVESDTFVESWAEWHRRHEALRADRHGFLAITGLHWLTEEPQRFPDGPNKAHFLPCILEPGEVSRQVSELRFAVT